MAERSLRLFVAIALPAHVRAALSSALEQVARAAPGAKPVPPENLHATLRFLGRTPLEALPGIEAAIAQAAREIPSFEAAVAGANSFGPRARPHVLYAGFSAGADAIAAAAGKVTAALAAVPQQAAQQDGRTPRVPNEAVFTAHITLARARGRRGDPDLAGARQALSELRAGSFQVSALALFESEVSKLGSRYRILREVPLPA